jgi:acetolactate decarboxylase
MSRRMYQISTSSVLVEGVYSGSVSSSTLLQHRDFGSGTFETLGGKMVVLDSLIYQIAGAVRLRSDDFLIPFAAVTRFHGDSSFEVGRSPACRNSRRHVIDTANLKQVVLSRREST